jgi:hypothetical protein
MEDSYVKVKIEDITKIKNNEKNIVLEKNVFRSEDLIEKNNPLWGYYPVKSFLINGEEIHTNEFYPEHYVLCGDCFEGECYVILRKKKNE